MWKIRGIYQGTLRYHDDSGSYLVDANGNKSRVDPNRINDLSEWTWHQRKDGYFSTYIFNDEVKKQKEVLLHNMVIGKRYGFDTDHINNDPSDNRVDNLQFISHRDNCTKDKKSKALQWDEKLKAWIVRINLPKTSKSINLGGFNTKEEATQQRNRALEIIETCTKEDLIALRNKYKRPDPRKNADQG